MRFSRRIRLGTLGAVALLATAQAPLRAQNPPGVSGDRQATFSKDVAPILQRACQDCHRPGMMAPMSL
ncbi:MAG TPA: hypothetical protein VGH34_06335, partial [Vicinamibacterales bacterium]